MAAPMVSRPTGIGIFVGILASMGIDMLTAFKAPAVVMPR